ncbi:MAG: hypothetical protein RLZZ24_1306, partial [Pseudomonadota bacterium]
MDDAIGGPKRQPQPFANAKRINLSRSKHIAFERHTNAMHYPTQPATTAVLASPEDMRQTLRRISHLKGRQPQSDALEQVQACIGPGPYRRDWLIEYLHALNDRHGCLREGHLVALAKCMHLGMVEVYEVASFY